MSKNLFRHNRVQTKQHSKHTVFAAVQSQTLLKQMSKHNRTLRQRTTEGDKRLQEVDELKNLSAEFAASRSEQSPSTDVINQFSEIGVVASVQTELYEPVKPLDRTTDVKTEGTQTDLAFIETISGVSDSLHEFRSERSGNHLIPSNNEEMRNLSARIEELENQLHCVESLHATDRKTSEKHTDSLKALLDRANYQLDQSAALLAQQQTELQESLSSNESLSERIATLELSFRNAVAEKNALELQLSASRALLQSREDQFTSAKRALSKDLEIRDAEIQRLSVRLSDMQSELSRCQSQCVDLKTLCNERLQRADDLETLISDSRTAYEKMLEEAKTDLTASKREVDSLSERLLKAEDKRDSVEARLRTQTQEIDGLNKAVFELGLENQSLQMFREQFNNRQWTKDSDAPNCSSCQREFSLSNRRHHCRKCGGVFCQVCSSNRAPTTSSKDPVRVCNTCFKKLGRQ